MANWKSFTLCEKDPANWDKYLNQVLASYRITPNLATAESPDLDTGLSTLSMTDTSST